MRRERKAGLTITIIAGGFLALDGVLLLVAGSWSGSVGLSLLGTIFLAGAASMVLVWRRYQRKLEELNQARAAMRQEFDLLRDQVRAHGRGEN